MIYVYHITISVRLFNTTIQVGKVGISIWKQYLIYLKIHGFNLFLQVYLIWSPRARVQGL